MPRLRSVTPPSAELRQHTRNTNSRPQLPPPLPNRQGPSTMRAMQYPYHRLTQTTSTRNVPILPPRTTAPNPPPSSNSSVGLPIQPDLASLQTPEDMQTCFHILSELTSQIRILQQRRAAERAAINSPTGTDSSVNSAEECCICSEILTAPESSVTKCGHVYHLHCIMRCPGIERGPIACPCCRKPVYVSELVTIRNGLPTLKPSAEANASAAVNARENSAAIEIIDIASDGEAEAPVVTDGGSASRRRPLTADRPTIPSEVEDYGKTLDAQIGRALRSTTRTLKRTATEYQKRSLALDRTLQVEREKYRIQKEVLEEEAKRKDTIVQDKMTQLVKDRIRIDKLENLHQQKSKELNDKLIVYKVKQSESTILRKNLDEQEKQIKAKEIDLNERLLSFRRREKRMCDLMESMKKRKRAANPAEDATAPEAAHASANANEVQTPANAFTCQFAKDDAIAPTVSESSEECIVRKFDRRVRQRVEVNQPIGSPNATANVGTPAAPAAIPNVHQPPPINRPAAARVSDRSVGRSTVGAMGPPVRRGAQGLSAFTSRRPTIQKPVGAIGKVSGVRRKDRQ